MRYYVVLVFVTLVTGCIQSDSPAGSADIWEYQTCGSVTAAPIVEEERAYISSYDGKVYCLHAFTGELLWNTELEEHHIRSSVIGATTLLVYSYRTLYALDLRSGEKLWEFSVDDKIQSVVSAEDVYMTTMESLFRIKEEDGTVVWEVPFSEPKYFGRALYVYKDRLFVEELNALGCYTTDAEKLWEFNVEGKHTVTPQLFFKGDTLFLVWRALYDIDIESGELLWSLDAPDIFLCALATEDHLIAKSSHSILCVDFETTEIVWEKDVEWCCVLGVLGDTPYLTAYRSPIDVPYSAEDTLFSGLVVRELDGEPLAKVDGTIFTAAVSRDTIVFSTEEGIVCFDGVTGEQMWSSSSGYPCRGITFEGERAYIASDNGKIYSFPLDSPFSFDEPERTMNYSKELGKVQSIHIDYFLNYCIGGLTRGEVRLDLHDNHYAVTGYEEKSTLEGEETITFEGTIDIEVVETFYESITELYVNSHYSAINSTVFADVTVEIYLETGEMIVLTAGSNMESLMPWTIEFRGKKGVQYTGLLSVTFDSLMSEVGWEHHHARRLYSWGVITSGLCQEPVSLLEMIEM